MRLCRIRPGWAALIVSLAFCWSCGDNTSSDPGPATTLGDQRLNFDEDPDVTALLASLAQGHARTRSQGPHRLQYRASFKVGPPDEDPLPRPVVGKGIATRQAVTDTLELSWASSPDAPPRFHLNQHNDKDAGREVVVVGERIYSHMAHRGWFERDIDGDIHELWLDDAQHAVHDVVSLAAPQLQLGDWERVELDGRPAQRLSLSLAGEADESLIGSQGGQGWRRSATVTAVTGTLTLDEATGLWLDAEIGVEYTTKDSEGRALLGTTELSAKMRFVDAADVTITVPADVAPTPERLRPTVDAEHLLGGLAGH